MAALNAQVEAKQQAKQQAKEAEKLYADSVSTTMGAVALSQAGQAARCRQWAGEVAEFRATCQVCCLKTVTRDGLASSLRAACRALQGTHNPALLRARGAV